MADDRENLARRYLLGQLPEAEQEALEAQFFANDELLEEIRAVENRLVDGYVRGRLSRVERRQFEQGYLNSEPHRERLALAHLLVASADAANVPTHEAPSLWSTFLATLRQPQWAWGIALAMLLVTVIGGTKLWRERAQLRAQLAAANASSANERALAEQLAAARQQNEQLTAALAEREPAPPSVTPPRATPKVFAFALTAGLLRGNGEQQTLAIPPQTAQVLLRMRLESDDYEFYQVNLRTVEGAEVWQRRQLKTRAGQLSATVPVAKLPAGDYLLTLSGVRAGTVEQVQRYFFRVSHL